MQKKYKDTILISYIVLITGALLLLSCTAPIKEFYPDSYKKKVYKNTALNFSLTFQGNWIISEDPQKMKWSLLKVAKNLQKRGAELLFAGKTSEGTQGVRAIAINYNATPNEYAEKIRSINLNNITKDLGIKNLTINNLPMVRWDYTNSGFRFVEYFFSLNTYNIRIAFWAKPNLFKRFDSVYLNIISSLKFTD